MYKIRTTLTSAVFASALIWAMTFGACGRHSSIPFPKQIVDLTPPLGEGSETQRLGTRTVEFLGIDRGIEVDPVIPADPSFAFGMQMIHLLSHAGAHLDAPARLLRGGESPARIGIDRLFGPARVIDLRWHDRHSPIEISDLEQTEVTEGDVAVLFLGYEPPVGNDWPIYASLSTHAAEWLVAKRIRAVATDVPAILNFSELENRLRAKLPPEQAWEEYLPFFRARVPVISGLVNLDAIVEEKNVTFVGLPLPFDDTNGAPARVAALVY